MGILKLFRKGAYLGMAFCLTFSYLCIFPVSKAGAIPASTNISTCEQLQAIGTNPGTLADSYIQTASFSCTGVEFVPIGTSGMPFIGTYDGGNFEITDLTIDSDAAMVGLFGKITYDTDLDSFGTVQNVKLVDASVTGTNAFTTVGALIGMNRGVVENSSSTGTVASSSHHTGGLVGYNTSDGSITDSSSTANVTGSGNYTGGLVGENGGSIVGSYATGIVEGSYYVGGLVGSNNTDMSGLGTIEGSYATGNVTATNNFAGGLVGYNDSALIELSYATGNVSGTYSTGGLVGYSVDSSAIQSSYATGIVDGSDTAGGLVGYNNNSTIELSYATGNITGTYRVGGLVGENAGGDITQSFATGSVTGTANRIGGLVGSNGSGGLYDTYAKGSVTGDTMVGGLVGANDGDGTIERSYATGVVDGLDYLGGLVGANRPVATVLDSYYDELTDQNDEGKGLLTTTEDMKSLATFTDVPANWNFENIWAIDTLGVYNNGYPYLQNVDIAGPTFTVLGSGDTRTVNIDAGQVITTNPYIIKVLPDDPSGVTKVEFYIDDILICTDTTADADGYYTCSWDTSKYHSDVKIIAYDAFGNATTVTRSTTVSLTGAPNTGLQPASYLSAGLVVIAGVGLMIVARRRYS